MDTIEQTTKKLPKDIAAEKGLVNVQVDGIWVQVPKGSRMIEACQKLAKEIPHYCYHSKLSSPGNCRMCLVEMGMPARLAPGEEASYNEQGYQEISWMPRPVISCANTVAENMGIRTQSSLVKECREGVMEFLLINHPLDCPICDQAGECTLQEYAVDHGRGESRFKEDKIKKPKQISLGNGIKLDDERCVLCSRCIRFMDEVANEPVLGFIDRGTHTKLTCHPDKKITSNYSQNIVDICPVGALTAEEFRFQMRVWFLKQTATIDTSCGTGCNITVWSRGEKVYRITPRQNNAVNSDWMPDNYRRSYQQLTSEKRLTDNLILTEDKHQAVSVNQLITDAVAILENASQVRIVLTANYTNEENFLLLKIAQKLAAKVTFIPQVGQDDGVLIAADKSPNTLGAKLIWQQHEEQSWQQLADEIAAGKVDALWVLGDSLVENDIIQQVPYILYAGTHANTVASRAKHVLPLSCSLETAGTMINICGRIQRLRQAVSPRSEIMETWQTLQLILTQLGEKNSYHLVEDIWQELSVNYSELNGLRYNEIGKLGKEVCQTAVEIPLLVKEKARKERGEIVG